jgi:exonuclease III
MIFLSLNLRGTGGTLKTASYRRVLDKTRPDIIFLQETLVHSEKARNFMSTLRPSWYNCAVNSVGTSGGMLVSWDPNVFELDAFLTCGGILLTGFSIENKKEVSFLNVYGPCVERKRFWNQVADSGLLSIKNLIIVGDMNLTLSSKEVWGGSSSVGFSDGFYKSLFQEKHLIDVAPGKIVPTWRNGWSGADRISKRLDRFLIAEDYLLGVGIYRSWV